MKTTINKTTNKYIMQLSGVKANTYLVFSTNKKRVTTAEDITEMLFTKQQLLTIRDTITTFLRSK